MDINKIAMHLAKYQEEIKRVEKINKTELQRNNFKLKKDNGQNKGQQQNNNQPQKQFKQMLDESMEELQKDEELRKTLKKH